MLPALQLGLSRDEEAPSYTRRPCWTRPQESLWSILAKWQFLNCLGYPALAACVSTLSRADIYQGVDLRVLEGFDAEALVHHSGVPRTSLAGGACSASAESPILRLASDRLRFCPLCMEEGFHATLFQFTPIVRCPVHGQRLLDACTGCGRQIPYRLNPVFAARPLACPHCSQPLVSDPTVLMRPGWDRAEGRNILKWQRFLAKYVYWYLTGTAGSARYDSSATSRLAFIGALQKVMHEPPSMRSIASRRTALAPRLERRNDAEFGHPCKPSFSAELWPHFRGKVFLDLCRRYARFHDHRCSQDSTVDRCVTH